MTVPGWVVDAVSPTEGELDRLVHPIDADVLAAVTDAVSPSSREVLALLARVRAEPARGGGLIPAFGAGGGSFLMRGLALAAAGVVTVGVATSNRAPPPPPPPVLAPLVIPAERAAPVILTAPERPVPTPVPEELPVAAPPAAPTRTVVASPPVDPLPTDPTETLAVLAPPVEQEPLGRDDEDVRNFTRIQESIDMNSAPATTLHLTELFLQRHPDSPLAEEATILRLELLAQTAPPRQAMAALDGWLSTQVDHPQFLRLLEVRADLARNGMQNCRAALASYRTLATRARGARKARASAFGGLCALSEGLDDEARESLSTAIADPFLPEALRFEVTEALAHLETMGRVVPLRKAQ